MLWRFARKFGEIVIGIGIDIEKIIRFEEVSKNFLDNIFTQKERKYCDGKATPSVSYSGKFCAKEAVVKALDRKLNLKRIEIINTESGKPEIYIDKKKADNLKCSISHTEDYSIAFVLMEGES